MGDVRALGVSMLLAAGCATSSGAGGDAWLAESLDRGAFHQAMGRSFYERGDFIRANSELIEALRYDPEDAKIHLLLGRVYVKRGLGEDAEDSFKRAIDHDEELVDAYAALGVLYDRSGRAALADQMHREAIRREPSRADLHNNLGFSLMLRELYGEAVKSFRAALRLGAGKKTHNNLGLAYARLGDLERAEKEFVHGGTRAEAKNNMGWVYELIGDTARAEAAYREATLLDPKLVLARHNLERLIHTQEELKP
jgi:Tfp pilus assembly protein PilF